MRLLLIFLFLAQTLAAETGIPSGTRFIRCLPLHKNTLEKFSIVHSCRDTKLKRRVIVKYVPKDKMLHELAIFSFTHSLDRAISLLDVVHDIDKDNDKDNHKIYAVIELGEGGDLFGYLEQSYKRKKYNGRLVFREAMRALLELHDHHIAHLDVKLENYILVRNPKAAGFLLKIGDFDSSELIFSDGHPSMKKTGTPRNMAPEVYGVNQSLKAEDPYGYDPFKADVYSAGIMLFHLLTNFSFYKVPSEKDDRFRLLKKLGVRAGIKAYGVEAIFNEGAISLLERMLDMNPDLRPTVREVLEDPWLQ